MATSKRARELERERLRRQAQRRAQQAARQRRIALVTGIVVFLGVIGAGAGLFVANRGGSSTTAGANCNYTPDPSTSASPSVSTGSSPSASASGSGDVGLPPDTKATGTHTATIVFTQGSTNGTVTISLDPKAPCTVNSFQYLTSKKFFDGTKCHREVTSGIYVLQCGDPTGTGSGGPGYTIPDENLTGATYKAGTVAMANAGADTGGSQFFIVYKDSDLPASYTPFGTVTAGMDVLNAIAAVGEDDSNGAGDGAPKIPVTITSFTIT